MVWEISSRIGAASAVHLQTASVRCDEDGADPKDEALDLLVDLHSYPQVWTGALRSRGQQLSFLPFSECFSAFIC